jgi:hypothetical protein
MRIKFLIISLILPLFLISCSAKKPLKSDTCLVILKTKEIKFADSAFINIWNSKATISAYFAGKSVLNIEFAGNVCVNNMCMAKDEFNSRFLEYTYYDNLFLDVLKGKELKLDGNIKKDKFGFMQKVRSDSYNIVYKVTKKEIFFRDSKNRIIIKLKELN